MDANRIRRASRGSPDPREDDLVARRSASAVLGRAQQREWSIRPGATTRTGWMARPERRRSAVRVSTPSQRCLRDALRQERPRGASANINLNGRRGGRGQDGQDGGHGEDGARGRKSVTALLVRHRRGKRRQWRRRGKRRESVGREERRRASGTKGVRHAGEYSTPLVAARGVYRNDRRTETGVNLAPWRYPATADMADGLATILAGATQMTGTEATRALSGV